jgi:hypothetical protein
MLLHSSNIKLLIIGMIQKFSKTECRSNADLILNFYFRRNYRILQNIYINCYFRVLDNLHIHTTHFTHNIHIISDLITNVYCTC